MSRTVLVFGFASVLAALSSAGCARQEVIHIRPDDPQSATLLQEPGIFFTLPRTVLTIEIPVERTASQGSPYLTDLAKAAHEQKEYLEEAVDRLDDDVHYDLSRQAANPRGDRRYGALIMRLNRLGLEPAKKKSTSFDLGKIHLASRTEPDPEQLYLLKLEGGLFSDREVSLDLAPNGIISAADIRFRDKTLDVTLEVIEQAARIAAVTGFGKWPINGPADNPIEKIFDFAEGIVTELEQVRARRRNAASSSRSSLAADLTRQEKTLSSYFVDASTETSMLRFVYVPQPGENPAVKLMEFDPTFGIRDERSSAVSGGMIPSNFRALSAGDPVTLCVTPSRALAGEQLPAEIIAGSRTGRGLPYRVPMVANVSLRIGDHEVLKESMTIAQLGTVTTLPEGMGGLESRFDVSYDPETGAITKIQVASEGLDRDDIEKIGDTVSDLLGRLDEIEGLEDKLDALKDKADDLDFNQ